MSFLIGHYMSWIFAALFLGVAAGWLFAERAGDEGRGDGKAGAYVLAFAGLSVALAIALFHALPGRFGHGLEVVLLLLVSYVLGCLIGEPLRLLTATPEKARAAPPQPLRATPATIMQDAQTFGRGSAAVAPAVAASATAALEEPVSDEHMPLLLAGPPSQGADDLKLIWGVGPKLEAMLNDLGIYRYAQIADWNEMNLRWVDQHLQVFRGRALRDRWIEQAKRLASGWRPDSAVGEKFED
jgi:predicted flap endonuclease-1-like 5' DNA nuclease